MDVLQLDTRLAGVSKETIMTIVHGQFDLSLHTNIWFMISTLSGQITATAMVWQFPWDHEYWKSFPFQA